MPKEQKPTKQKLENTVREFSHLILDYSEIRNNPCSELPTEDEARYEIARRNLEKRCYVPDLPNEEYLAFKRSIPKKEVNKFIDEAKRGKKLWDRLESRLNEIQEKLKDPAFKYLPEIFTSNYCQKIENPGNVLCFISEIEKEFKKEKFYLPYTPNYETAFKDFLFYKLKNMGDRWMGECGKEIEELSPAETEPGAGGEVVEPTYKWGFNKEKRTVSCNGGKSVKLQPIHFNLWHYLFTHAGKKIKPDTLYRECWKNTSRDCYPDYKRTVQDAINKCRKSLLSCKLTKAELELIIQDIKKGKDIVAYQFNKKITLNRHF